ncbi:dnaJ homolog subfamily C member 22 [Denticeps clupeoides]|uniref:DnaJ homolog subfamily C member 22 n=1 Tax=Denticeps clupeoides TaxID=299321 RepID=A0AAY4EKI9_9TELE|nr:dnaJ homolog subfamily C member 22 [Denticeps clupeoides]
MAKKLMVTYALWAMGGPLGLHHLYLGRDSHALLWMLTMGGFGMGWAREFFRIPSYVSEANQEAKGKRRRPSTETPPPASPARFAGQVCVGVYFGTVALVGLNSLDYFYLIVLPLSVGAGVHLVSNVGSQTSDLRRTLAACLVTSPVFYGSKLSPLPISLAASVAAAQHRRFKPPRPAGTPPEPLFPRLYRLSLALMAFSAPLGYCVFHNTTATLYYASDCVAAVLNALWFLPWLRGALEYCLLLPYRVLRAVTGGVGYSEEAWRKVLEILLQEYSEREKEALKVLSAGEDATFEQITHQYRELIKTWHPDHNPDKPLEAQQTFIKIQEAYETLLRKKRRHRGK